MLLGILNYKTTPINMPRKIKTMKLQGKDYAKVADRLRAIHEDHKDFDIETDCVFQADGAVLTAKLTIREDKVVRVFNGHSYGKVGGQKALEKLETIAVGRALAFAGYHADGEIASADEMQDMAVELDQEIVADAVMQIMDAKSVPELEKTYKSLPQAVKQSKEVIDAGKKRKKELTEIE